MAEGRMLVESQCLNKNDEVSGLLLEMDGGVSGVWCDGYWGMYCDVCCNVCCGVCCDVCFIMMYCFYCLTLSLSPSPSPHSGMAHHQ